MGYCAKHKVHLAETAFPDKYDDEKCSQCSAEEDAKEQKRVQERLEDYQKEFAIATSSGRWICGWCQNSTVTSRHKPLETYARSGEFCEVCGNRNPVLPPRVKYCVKCKRAGTGNFCSSCGGKLQ